MQSSVNSLSDKQNSITNSFLEEAERSLEEVRKIWKTLLYYDLNMQLKNFHLEIEFDLIKLNLRYLESILSCFEGYKNDYMESLKVKMLKLFDFILHEFKRLRNKYEEMNEFYFGLDEENKYIINIKKFMKVDELKPTKIGCLYLRLLNHYLKKISKKLKSFNEKEYKISKGEKEKFSLSNNKIQLLCKVIYGYLVEDDKCSCLGQIQALGTINTNELLKLAVRELNASSDTKNSNSSRLTIFISQIIIKIHSKIKNENSHTKKLLSKIKIGINSFIHMLSSDADNDLFLDLMPDTKVIKMMFEALENKLGIGVNTNINSNNSEDLQRIKTNEIIYFFPKKNLENFKLLNEKEGQKRIQNGSMASGSSNPGKNLIRIRILTNQAIKINYDHQNLLATKTVQKFPNMKEINFFGLLLRVSKDFLTPSYNVIFHIPGGGFFSQSSESHLAYLTHWARKTDSVIISLDYKLSNDNKYPIILDECVKAYEILVTYSAKLFNFHINKLILYSDSVGSLIALDIIKYSLKNNIRAPDSSVLVYPCPNIVIDNLSYIKDCFTLIGFDDNSLEVPLQVKLQEILLESKDRSSINNDDRLNFFLSDRKIVSLFPKTMIISSANDPIKEDCFKLAEFLKSNNVNVYLKELVYYCNGFLQIPSLFDSHSQTTLEYTLKYISEFFKPPTCVNNISSNEIVEGKKLEDRRNSLNSWSTTHSSL